MFTLFIDKLMEKKKGGRFSRDEKNESDNKVIEKNERFQLIHLPPELQLDITELDREVYLKWPLLSKQMATATRFDSALRNHGKWLQKRRKEERRIILKEGQRYWRNGVLERESKIKWVINNQGEEVKVRQQYWRFGNPHGEYKEWYRNGTLQTQKYYDNGKLEGEHKGWYDDGNKEYCFTHVNGKQEGVCKVWHTNGQLEVLCNYVNGKLEGVYKRWYKDGRVIDQHIYVDGIEQEVE